jgi:predicted ATPase/DNA-binding winged helix-turn-helix (wHTH) protein
MRLPGAAGPAPIRGSGLPPVPRRSAFRARPPEGLPAILEIPGYLFTPNSFMIAEVNLTCSGGSTLAKTRTRFVPPASTLPSRPPMHDYQTFGSIEIHHGARRLLVDGSAVDVGARAFDILASLARHGDRVVSKQELFEAAWPGRIVQENNLAVQINTLRKLLGPGRILTVAGRGYRFAPAEGVPAAEDPRSAIDRPAAPPDAAREEPGLGSPRLIGRDREFAELTALVARHRLVTVVGAGGVGKSSLARRLVESPDLPVAAQVRWAPLGALPLNESGRLVEAIAAAMGVRVGGDATPDTFAAALAPTQLLIVIDGCEHVLNEAAALVDAVLRGAPNVRLLLTSQVPLRLPGEQVMHLGPLALPPSGASAAQAAGHGAVALFVDRVKALDDRFELTADNLAATIDICRSLDGLPLAIEFAAARVPMLGVQGLATALDKRLHLLTSRRRDTPRNQLSLHAALNWSHDLLENTARKVLRRISVCPASFSFELAEELCKDDTLDAWNISDALGTLIDGSWVQMNTGAATRLGLLESPRTFAAEQLEASGETANIRARHAQVMRRHVVSLRRLAASGHMRIDAVNRELDLDLENVRAALAWGIEHDPETAVALAPSLGVRLQLAEFDQARTMWRRTSELLDPSMPMDLRADWLLGCALFWVNRDVVLTVQRAREAVAAYEELGDAAGAYCALAVLLTCQARQRDPVDDTMARMERVEVQPLPVHARLAGKLSKAMLAAFHDRYEESLEGHRQSLELALECGDVRTATICELNMADVEAMLGRYADSAARGLLLANMLRASLKYNELATALLNLCGAMLAADNPGGARQAAEEGWPLAARNGLLSYWSDHLARMAAQETRGRDAARLLGFGDAQYAIYGTHRVGIEAMSAGHAERIARLQLDDAEFQRLRAEGRRMSNDEMQTIALRKAEHFS